MEEPFGTCDPHLGRSAVKEFVSVWELPFYLANLRSQTGGTARQRGIHHQGQNFDLLQWLITTYVRF